MTPAPKKSISTADKQAAASTKQKTAERRRYMRFNTPLTLEYRTLTLNPIFGKALAKDLSREGVRFGLKHDLPAGTPLEIALNVPGDNLPVFATGKVAWADGLEAGLRLTKISKADQTRVLEYVYNEWLKSTKKTEL